MVHTPENDMLTVADAAKLAGVHVASLYGLVKQNKIFHVSKGDSVYVRRGDVIAYREERARRRRLGINARLAMPDFSQDAAPADEEIDMTDTVHDLVERAGAQEPPALAAAFIAATATPSATVTTAGSDTFTGLRARIALEVGAVRHQLQGVSDQIKRLEADAERMMREEERLASMLAKAKELEEFARTL